MRDEILRVEDLHVTITNGAETVHAVNGVSLTLRRGRVTALVGESGSGKSMTARAVVSLLPRGAVAGGRVWFGDEDLLVAGERRLRNMRGRTVAIVFQNPSASLSPYVTLGRQFRELVRAHRHAVSVGWDELALAALSRAGLDDPDRILDAYAFELSGGQQQRVALALAIALRPSVLLADEITTALDVTTQAQVLEQLCRLARQESMGVLFITHDLALAGRWADDLAVMYGGLVVEQGSVDEVISRPRHPYTVALVACQPSIDGCGRLEPIPGRAETVSSPLTGCPFAGRCRYGDDTCGAHVPVLVGDGPAGAERAVACWHPQELVT